MQDEIKKELENAETEMKKPKAEETEMGKEDYNSIRDTHLVVAALVATVAFTAGLTLPGRYKSNEGPDQGTALVARVATFKAFVITNAFAMVLSFSAIVVYLKSSLTVRRELEKQFGFGVALLEYAMIATMIAFMSGSYAVLANSSDLAVGVLITGSFGFIMIHVCLAIGIFGSADKTLLEWLSGRKIRRVRKRRN